MGTQKVTSGMPLNFEKYVIMVCQLSKFTYSASLIKSVKIQLKLGYIP